MVLCVGKPTVFSDVVVSHAEVDHENEGCDMYALQHDGLWGTLEEIHVRPAQFTCPAHAEIGSGYQTVGATEGPDLA